MRLGIQKQRVIAVNGSKEKKGCLLGNPGQALRLHSPQYRAPCVQALRCEAGQALVELAVFASVFLMILGLLVRYGLDQNYSQQIQMSAFRRALRQSVNPIEPGNFDGKDLEGTSLFLVEDRRMPSTSGTFGIAARTPSIAAASVTWSEDLSKSRDFAQDFNSPLFKEELPTMDYIIDGQRIEITTAWGYYLLNAQSSDTKITVKVDDQGDNFDINGNPVSDGIYWRWMQFPPDSSPLSDYVDKNEGGIPLDLDGDGKREVISSADVDGDGKEESLFYEFNDQGEFVNIWYLDHQKGELDTSQDSRDIEEDKPGQGLFETYLGPDDGGKSKGDYKRVVPWGSANSFNRVENRSRYKTTTEFNVEDYIYRTFYVNSSNCEVADAHRVFPNRDSDLKAIDSIIYRREKQTWETSPVIK